MDRCQCILASTNERCENLARHGEKTCVRHKYCESLVGPKISRIQPRTKTPKSTKSSNKPPQQKKPTKTPTKNLTNTLTKTPNKPQPKPQPKQPKQPIQPKPQLEQPEDPDKEWEITSKFLTGTLSSAEEEEFEPYIAALRPVVHQIFTHDNMQYFVHVYVQPFGESIESIIHIYNLRAYVKCRMYIARNLPYEVHCHPCATMRREPEGIFIVYQLYSILYNLSSDNTCRLQLGDVRQTGSSYLKFILEYVRTESAARNEQAVIRLSDMAYVYQISGVEDAMPKEIVATISSESTKTAPLRINISVIMFFKQGVTFYEKYGFQPSPYLENVTTVDELQTQLTSWMDTVNKDRRMFLAKSKTKFFEGMPHHDTEKFIYSFRNFLTTWEFLPTFKDSSPGYMKLAYATIETICGLMLQNYLDESITRDTYLTFLKERADLLNGLDRLLLMYSLKFYKYIYVI